MVRWLYWKHGSRGIATSVDMFQPAYFGSCLDSSSQSENVRTTIDFVQVHTTEGRSNTKPAEHVEGF